MDGMLSGVAETRKLKMLGDNITKKQQEDRWNTRKV